MIDKIHNNQIQDLVGKTPTKQPDPAKTVPGNDADVALHVDYASLVEKVMEAEQADSGSVKKARELLISGRLDSRENARAAAEDMILFGI